LNLGEITASLRLNLLQFQQSLQTAQRQLQTASEKMKTIGATMSAAVTAPLAAAGGIMLKGAMDAEAANGRIQASLGITAQEAKRLGEIAKQSWTAGFGENIQEVTQNLISVRQSIGEINDADLKKVTEGAMMISDVFGEDVSATTSTAAVMMKNFDKIYWIP